MIGDEAAELDVFHLDATATANAEAVKKYAVQQVHGRARRTVHVHLATRSLSSDALSHTRPSPLALMDLYIPLQYPTVKLVKGEAMMSYTIDGPEHLTSDELYKWVNETVGIERRCQSDRPPSSSTPLLHNNCSLPSTSGMPDRLRTLCWRPRWRRSRRWWLSTR